MLESSAWLSSYLQVDYNYDYSQKGVYSQEMALEQILNIGNGARHPVKQRKLSEEIDKAPQFCRRLYWLRG
jgi:hypothetical protein